MTDSILAMAIGNTLFVAGLAVLILVVRRWLHQPGLVHILCLVALIKLLTPPVFQLDVLPTWTATADVAPIEPATVPDIAAPAPLDDRSLSDIASSGVELRTPQGWVAPHDTLSRAPFPIAAWPQLLVIASLLVSLVLAVTSVTRMARFSWLMREQRRAPSPELTAIARRLSRRMGLVSCPRLWIVRAPLSPMIWWAGLRPCIILPESAMKDLPDAQLRWILAHELVHIRRRDHWTRWLEWSAGLLFWWNPLTWWIQRELRLAEEICCDQWVMRLFRPSRREYAHSIVNIVETLARPTVRPPAMASEINSGGFLEKRIENIMKRTTQPTPSRLTQVMAVAIAILVIPFGLAHSQDFEKVERKLRKSVEKGQLSEHQANAMLELLERMMHDEEVQRHQHELRTHANELEREMARTQEEMNDVRQRIRAMKERLEAGQVDEQEGAHQLDQLREHLEELEYRMADLEGEMHEVQLAHEEMAREQAERKSDMARRRDMEMREQAERRLNPLRRRIERAVEAGEIREAEAREKMRAAEREVMHHLGMKLGEHDDHNMKNRVERELRAVQEKLTEAVRRGEMDKEEAHEKLMAIKKKLMQRWRGEHEDDDHADESEDDDFREKLRAISQELKQAVDEGKMSPEVAEEKFAQIRQKLEKARNRWVDDDDDENEWDEDDDVERDGRRAAAEKMRAITEEIRQAVREGELSEDEAREKIRELRMKWRRSRLLHDDDDDDHDADEGDDDDDHHVDEDDDDEGEPGEDDDDDHEDRR